ncbi:unnamed protein product, partial [Didymodactylos carnosus]
MESLSTLDTILFVLAFLAIVCGMLLSKSGSGGGISALSGQEIELFKKSKSRGFIRYVQVAMFLIGIAIIVITFARILNFYKRDNFRPASADQTAAFLKEPIELVKKELDLLLANKVVSLVGSMRYTLTKNVVAQQIDRSISHEGVLSVIKSGAGFVKMPAAPNVVPLEYYVDQANLNSAMHGDTVRVSPVIVDFGSSRQVAEAIVTGVVKRGKDFFVAEVVAGEKPGTLRLVADDLRITLPLVLDSYAGLVPGHKILFKVSEFESNQIYGSLAKIIGHANDPEVDMMSIVHEFGAEPEFSEEALEFANQLTKVPFEQAKTPHHEDLTSFNFITIDPHDAKDLDDAVCVKENDDGTYLLYVAIADLGSYVPKDSALDLDAYMRGTSIYLTNKVIPMVPHALSNDICSLNPHVPKLTVTCEMRIDQQGQFLEMNTYPSVIATKRRFSYGEVNDFFSKKTELENDHDDIKKMLTISKKLHEILRKDKMKRGYIDFDLKEPKVIVDQRGKAIDVIVKERGIAQRMIEDFMIAANEAMTLLAQKNKLPFVYRVHDRPSAKKLTAVKTFAIKAGFSSMGDIETIKADEIASWLSLHHHLPNYSLVSKLILRKRIALKESLDEACEQSSLAEVRAVEIERAVNSMKFAEMMNDRLGEEFSATVSTVTNFGFFVELENTIEGLVPI